ncbi:MAG: flagellar type III secretion system protein FliR [Chloroflexi bacterium]|nr:flagellar type III secretion system protein FliR [Chloroflexota bacterium]
MDVFVSSPLYYGNFFLIFVRCTTVFLVAPVFSSRNFPSVAKVGFGLFMALVLLPLNSQDLTPLPGDTGLYLLLVGQEVLVGLLIGFAAHVIYSAVQLAAALIGVQIGFSFPGVIDPAFSSQTSFMDQFYAIFAGLVFLAVNGHHMVLLALQQSFDIVPLGKFVASQNIMDRLVAIFTGSFGVALRIALPVIGALMLADVALGLLARTVPTLNVLVVGLPIKIVIGFVVIGISLPFVASVSSNLFTGMWKEIGFLIRGT